jgi:hypothetical protein
VAQATAVITAVLAHTITLPGWSRSSADPRHAARPALAPRLTEVVHDLGFMRDFSRAELLDDEQLKHLARIAHYCYQSYDLELRCLVHLEQRGAATKGASQRYRETLSA